MPSIVNGYSYDIFISYRHKDNKGEKWVSEFVSALKAELEATIKEEVTVYFDENPHDNLLETHDVRKTLDEKLRCLVFIPVLSQTYCDPGSYAWKHEFLPFITMAMNDGIGRDIKLRNGNITSRILPVRIHDLESQDIKLFEKETCRPLRALDFVYRTSGGVNRPLRLHEDHPADNLGKTSYRDQINKVANAIKEIIYSIVAQQHDGKISVSSGKTLSTAGKEKNKRISRGIHPGNAGRLALILLAGLMLIIITGYFFPPLVRKRTIENLRAGDGRLYIRIYPFQNLTSDTTWNVWELGIQDMLIATMSNSEEIRVRPYESASGIPRVKGKLDHDGTEGSAQISASDKSDAAILVFGSLSRAGATIRLNARLVNAGNDELLKSFQVDESSDRILKGIDSLALILKNYLIIRKLSNEITPDFVVRTNSPDAFRYYIYGLQAFRNLDFPSSRTWFFKALSIDSNMFVAQLYLPWAFGNQPGNYAEAKYWCRRIYDKMNREENSNRLTISERLLVRIMYAEWFGSLEDENKYLKQYIEINDQAAVNIWMVGMNYTKMGQGNEAIPYLERSLQLYEKWNVKPYWIYNYTLLGSIYHTNGQFSKERELYLKAEKYFKDNPDLLFQEAVLAVSENKNKEAEEIIERFRTVLRDNSESEAWQNEKIAEIYHNGGNPGRAEEYYRKAVALNPEDPRLLHSLSRFLVDSKRNLSEAIDLIDRAIKLSPAINGDNYGIWHTKANMLYSQGNLSRAMEIYEKCLRIAPKNDYGLYQDAENARNAMKEYKVNWQENPDTKNDLFTVKK